MTEQGFRVFLASPSGLEDHRRAAREVADQIRRDVAGPLEIPFDLIGWEDIRPGYGRPQSRINPELDRCNVLVGIVGRYLGSPSGHAESGFVEEYERMAKRRQDGEDVDLLVYTLRLSNADLDDPGPKLSQALDFRDRLQREGLLREFSTADGFARILQGDLTQLVTEAYRKRQLPEASNAVRGPGAVEGPGQLRGNSDDPAAEQLRRVLSGAANDLPGPPGGDAAPDPFALSRLHLWLSAWLAWSRTNETLAIHAANQLYRYRDGLAATPLELRHILRTQCDHGELVPAWAMLNEHDPIPDLLAITQGDRESAIRAGALEMLDLDALKVWLSHQDAELELADVLGLLAEAAMPPAANDAFLGLLERCGAEEAVVLLALLAADGTHNADDATDVLVRVLSRALPDEAFELASGVTSSVSEATIETLDRAASEASLETLRGATQAPASGVRLLALEEIRRRQMGTPELYRLHLEDRHPDVRAVAFLALCESETEVPEEVLQDQLKRRQSHTSLGRRVKADLSVAWHGTRPAEELQAELNWVWLQTAAQYQALAEAHFDLFAGQVRRDLKDRFQTFRSESRRAFEQTLGPELLRALKTENPKIGVREDDGTVKPVESSDMDELAKLLREEHYNEVSFATAALAGLAKNGTSDDAPLIRLWLDSDDTLIQSAAATALVRCSTAEDAPRLVELAQAAYGDEAARLAAAACSLSPRLDGAALDLLSREDGDAALAGARHLYSQPGELPHDTLMMLLNHKHDAVRKVGVVCAVRQCAKEGLARLLDEYTNQASHYYNVVHWLDRAVFAPEWYRARSLRQLADFAAGEVHMR